MLGLSIDDDPKWFQYSPASIYLSRQSARRYSRWRYSEGELAEWISAPLVLLSLRHDLGPGQVEVANTKHHQARQVKSHCTNRCSQHTLTVSAPLPSCCMFISGRHQFCSKPSSLLAPTLTVHPLSKASWSQNSRIWSQHEAYAQS